MTQFAATIAQGDTESILVPVRRTIEIKTTNEAEVIFDSFRSLRVVANRPARFICDGYSRFKIKAVIGTVNYAIFGSDIVPFVGNLTLTAADDGKLLRCDDSSNVTVTVPATLAEGFSIGLAMWGAGTVTVAAGSGATKRSSTSALGTQYQWGSLLVGSNANDAAAEFVLGGSFA